MTAKKLTSAERLTASRPAAEPEPQSDEPTGEPRSSRVLTSAERLAARIAPRKRDQ